MLRFNMLLDKAGISPSSVRLLRHQPVLPGGVVLIDQFHRDRAALLAWQSIQAIQRTPHLAAPFWASFIGTPDGRTVFEGLYRVAAAEAALEALYDPLTGETILANTCRRYALQSVPEFEPYSGRVLVDWGGGPSGKRAWIQRADNQDKPISSILECPFEQPFPGYLAFHNTVGALNCLTPNWADQLRRAKGVYLLSCPHTGRLYTGSATGLGGFWERWQSYFLTGHGGNQGLKECDTSRFTVSILQVAGSTATADDILADEQVWKAKLLSREFGYNRN